MIDGPAAAPPTFELDHLAVAARTLDEGVAWCEATLGVVPAPGGRHALMGTHNRLLAIGSARYPRSYLEIVAIDPDAPAPARPRWFELDRAELQASIAKAPRLVHWVARTNAIDAAAKAWRAAGHEPGVPTPAERMTPRGLLRWHISVREDGGRPEGGAVPLLIEWGDTHPCDTLPSSGASLVRFELGGVPATLASRLGVDVSSASVAQASALVATLDTLRGPVELRSPPPAPPARETRR